MDNKNPGSAFMQATYARGTLTAIGTPWLAPCAWLVMAVAAPAQDPFGDLNRGLLANYSDGTREASRVDTDIAFTWGSAAPLPELEARKFNADWTGALLVKSESTYHFHVWLSGSTKVTLNGEVVLEGKTQSPGWVTGPAVSLQFGFLPLHVHFEKTAEQAELKLFWSAETFALEPIPSHLLFNEEDVSRPELAERGRVLFDAYRCNRCHVHSGDVLSEAAPPFATITAGLNSDWLLAKLRHKHAEAGESKMPSFDFNEPEAKALAAWLADISQPPQLDTFKPELKAEKKPDDKKADEKKEEKKPKKDSTPNGETLVHSLGCLACHKIGELGQVGPHGGGDLSQIGGKRSADWLHTWLARPEVINPQRRMPTFKLTSTEVENLTEALSKLGRSGKSDVKSLKGDRKLVEQGRELAKQARCFNCHAAPGMEANAAGIPALDRPVQDWTKSCLGDAADRATGRPYYPQAAAAAIIAYVESRRVGAVKQQLANAYSPFTHGQLVMERRNCLACHERGEGRGIVATAGAAAATVEKLRGQSEAMIPPNLTAVGDKLQDAALNEAVAGEQKSIRMPWLKVRMPRFEHAPQDRSDLVAFLTGHDLIPPGAPSAGEPTTIAGEADAAALLAGRSLVGVGGFSCIACHTVGEYEPRNVALGTKGSDLKGIGARMREEFFIRWTRAPLRVVPGMEMPSYEKPVRGVLDENVHTQIAALWGALNDPRFKAPTNPTQVEQFLTVAPGEPPRIVRDVFAVSQENGGGYVARALAIGFDNGHSLLFDLDTATVREWTYGDFARQRTEGKSWYWDMAGQPVMAGLPANGTPVLESIDSPPGGVVDVVTVDRTAKAVRYRIVDQPGGERGVELAYSLTFDSREVDVTELFTPWKDADGRTGWQRRITGIPPRVGMRVSLPETARGIGAPILPEARIDIGAPTSDEFVTTYIARVSGARPSPPPLPAIPPNNAPVTTAPGFRGERLKLPTSIMPTALAWRGDGTLVFTSLKGHVYLASDGDGDGFVDSLTTFAEGLAAPFGILPDGNDLLVAHKPELLRLMDHDGDGKSDEWKIVADGWGYSDNYHDWTTGPVRDADGNLYVALGSDYSQPGRVQTSTQWRGKMLKVTPSAGGTQVTPFAHELRFPMGIAFDPRGRLFISDQQGVQNTWNEIDHIVEGRRYGVPALYDPPSDLPETRAAVEVPHPLTRSVNGIFFIPTREGEAPAEPQSRGTLLSQFAGHGIGCEYNGKFLVRFSFQEVDGELQGALYLFSRNTFEHEQEAFLGPICGDVGPDGNLYIGSIHDSGWLGGLNTGEIVRLTPEADYPNGIRELRGTADGFEIEFLKPVDVARATQPESYSLSGATRVWQGAYATEDSGQYQPRIKSLDLSDDGLTVRLHVDRVEPKYVYEVAVKNIGFEDQQPLFPNTGYYSMNRVPSR